MPDNKYHTPHALLQAINDRLRVISEKEPISVTHLRRHLAFDRFLVRLFLMKNCPWILKGGYAMELRTHRGRATKDLDLAMLEGQLSSDSSQHKSRIIYDLLVDAVSVELNDFFIFEISNTSLQLFSPPEGGFRFPVRSVLDGKTFTKFHIDIGMGDINRQPFEKLKSRDWLGFAGIETVPFLAISKEQQFAEKLYVYTIPRNRKNSRVKDIVDMILLIKNKELSSSKVIESTHAVFKHYGTHEIPNELLPPPSEWEASFSQLAEECGLNIDIVTAFNELSSYYSKLKW